MNRVFAGGFGLALHPGATAHLGQPFASIACRLNGDTARVATKSRLPPPGLLAQGFDREVAEIEEEFLQGGTKQ